MGHVKSAKALLDEMQAIWVRADRAGRDLTPSERNEVEELLGDIKQMKSIEDLGRELGAGFTSAMGDGSMQPLHSADPGSAFTASEGYKKVRTAAGRGQNWTTGVIEVPLSA